MRTTSPRLLRPLNRRSQPPIAEMVKTVRELMLDPEVARTDLDDQAGNVTWFWFVPESYMDRLCKARFGGRGLKDIAPEEFIPFRERYAAAREAQRA
jgi:hypothetical protein